MTSGFRPGMYRGGSPSRRGWIIILIIVALIFVAAALV